MGQGQRVPEIDLMSIQDIEVAFPSVVRQKFLNNRRLLTVWRQLYQPRPGAPSDRCLRREASFLPSL
jgi:hypothetical protein